MYRPRDQSVCNKIIKYETRTKVMLDQITEGCVPLEELESLSTVSQDHDIRRDEAEEKSVSSPLHCHQKSTTGLHRQRVVDVPKTSQDEDVVWK